MSNASRQNWRAANDTFVAMIRAGVGPGVNIELKRLVRKEVMWAVKMQPSRVSRTRSRPPGGPVVKVHVLYRRYLRSKTESPILDGYFDVVVGRL